MKLNGQLHASAALSPGEAQGTLEKKPNGLQNQCGCGDMETKG